MSFTPVNSLYVRLEFGDVALPVGRLAIRAQRIYFEYDRAFLPRRLEISPQRLTLQPGVRSFDPVLFEGLPGVFNDSLPDGWGRLLFDRAMRAQGVLPGQVSPLDRLAHVGRSGMGALTYEPDVVPHEADGIIDLDRMAGLAKDVLEGKADEVLGELAAHNGASGGARPKALIGYNCATGAMVHGQSILPEGFAPWLVKFPNTQDGADAGAIEYVYALMAKAAGVEMTEAHLFPSKRGAGYFATRRFDRNGASRVHAHTASGILHTDHKAPSLDYQDLLALSMIMTRDIREAEKMFRLAVFNVLAHNRDDHAKNFTFLMNAQGEWRLSPAYDLTFSSGPGGEQSTMVMGQGKSPSVSHLTTLGVAANLPLRTVQEVIDQTREALVGWRNLAKAHGVRAVNVTLIEERIATRR